MNKFVTKKIAFVVALGAFGSLGSGCPSTPRTDAGPPDTGISIPDAPARDAFRRPDTNTAPMMCSDWAGADMTGIAPIPASCTPRCTNATLGAVNTCQMMMDAMARQACQTAALEGDTTPTVDMMGPGGVIPLDCATCFQFNQLHCLSVPCPTQIVAAVTCNRMMDPDMCMEEFDAADTCLAALTPAQEMAANTCLNTQLTACFDTSGAFAPTTVRQLRLTRNYAGLAGIAR
jgi:hypothetical protein